MKYGSSPMAFQAARLPGVESTFQLKLSPFLVFTVLQAITAWTSG